MQTPSLIAASAVIFSSMLTGAEAVHSKATHPQMFAQQYNNSTQASPKGNATTTTTTNANTRQISNITSFTRQPSTDSKSDGKALIKQIKTQTVDVNGLAERIVQARKDKSGWEVDTGKFQPIVEAFLETHGVDEKYIDQIDFGKIKNDIDNIVGKYVDSSSMVITNICMLEEEKDCIGGNIWYGTCLSCDPSAKFNKSTGKCYCPNGFTMINNKCVQKCPSRKQLDSNGQCVCQPGLIALSNGDCVDPCPPDDITDSRSLTYAMQMKTGICYPVDICKIGYVRIEEKCCKRCENSWQTLDKDCNCITRCQGVKVGKDCIVCQVGEVFNPSTKKCEPVPPPPFCNPVTHVELPTGCFPYCPDKTNEHYYYMNAFGKCIKSCILPRKLDANQNCVIPPPPKPCDDQPGTYWFEPLKKCLEPCQDGFKRDDATGDCKKECEFKEVNGDCEPSCEEPFYWDETLEQCLYQVGPTPYCESQVKINGNCIVCKNGCTIQNDGQCLCPTPVCPEGQHLNDEQECIIDPPVPFKCLAPKVITYHPQTKGMICSDPCPEGYTRKDTGACVLPAHCETWQYMDGKGDCQPPDKPDPKCIAPSVWWNDSKCITCPPGDNINQDGKCVTPDPVCKDGKILTLEKTCECPQKPKLTIWDEKTQSCREKIPLQFCVGQKLYRDPISKTCKCKQAYTHYEDKGCVCEAPNIENIEKNECTPDEPDPLCPKNKVRIQKGGQCYCEAGLVQSGDDCVNPLCSGSVKLDENGKCPPEVKCDEGEEKNEKGECVCPKGYEHKDLAKTICGVIECKKNQYRDPFTQSCFCDHGFETDDFGNCKPKECPTDQSLDASNNCVCKEEGYQVQVSKPENICVKIDPVCKHGYYLDQTTKECLPIKCKEGEQLQADGVCEKICKSNQYWSSFEQSCKDICKEGSGKINSFGTSICECKSGKAFNESTGKCEDVCLPPSYKNENGVCEHKEICNKDKVLIEGICYDKCLPGYTRNQFKICEKDIVVCETGYFWNTITEKCEQDPIPPEPCKDQPNMYLNPITKRCEKICDVPNVIIGDKCYPPCKKPEENYSRNGETGECMCKYTLTQGGQCNVNPTCTFPQWLDIETNKCKVKDDPPCKGVLIDNHCYDDCKKENNEHMNFDTRSCDCNVDYQKNTLSGICEPTCEKQGLKTGLDGTCYKPKPPCNKSELTSNDGECYCPQLTIKNKENGLCENCPEGYTLSIEGDKCILIPCENYDKVRAPNSKCVDRCYETQVMTFEGSCECPKGQWLQKTTNRCMECEKGYIFDPVTKICKKQDIVDPCDQPGDVFDSKSICCPTQHGGWLNAEGICQPKCFGTIIDYKCYENCILPQKFDFELKRCIDPISPGVIPATWRDVYDGNATAADVLKQEKAGTNKPLSVTHEDQIRMFKKEIQLLRSQIKTCGLQAFKAGVKNITEYIDLHGDVVQKLDWDNFGKLHHPLIKSEEDYEKAGWEILGWAGDKVLWTFNDMKFQAGWGLEKLIEKQTDGGKYNVTLGSKSKNEDFITIKKWSQIYEKIVSEASETLKGVPLGQIFDNGVINNNLQPRVDEKFGAYYDGSCADQPKGWNKNVKVTVLEARSDPNNYWMKNGNFFVDSNKNWNWVQTANVCTDQKLRITHEEFLADPTKYPPDQPFWAGKCDGSWTYKPSGFNMAYIVTESVENLTGKWEQQPDGKHRWIERCKDSANGKIPYTLTVDNLSIEKQKILELSQTFAETEDFGILKMDLPIVSKFEEALATIKNRVKDNKTNELFKQVDKWLSENNIPHNATNWAKWVQ